MVEKKEEKEEWKVVTELKSRLESCRLRLPTSVTLTVALCGSRGGRGMLQRSLLPPSGQNTLFKNELYSTVQYRTVRVLE